MMYPRYNNSEIEQKLLRVTASFNQKIRKMSHEYKSKLFDWLNRQQMTESLVEVQDIQYQIATLTDTYRLRYKNELLNYKVHIYSYVQLVCKYPFFEESMGREENMSWAKCRRKQLDDLMATKVSAVILTHELTPYIFSLIVGKRTRYIKTRYINILESRFQRLKSWNHDRPRVRVFFSQLQKEIDRLHGDDLSGAFSLLANERASEMEVFFQDYERTGALSFNNCRFCKSASPLCEELNTGKLENPKTVKEIRRLLLRTFRLNVYEALEVVVSKVKNG